MLHHSPRSGRLTMAAGSPGKVGFVSLGCAKATVDSERILTELRVQGYQMTAQYGDADLVIGNTCGFIDDAIYVQAHHRAAAIRVLR